MSVTLHIVYLIIGGSIMCVVKDQVKPYALSLWCSARVVCASAGYTLCIGRKSVRLCALSLQNLAVPRSFIPLSVTLWNDFGDPVFHGVV